MLNITPEDIQNAKEKIQTLRDRAYDYFLKNNKKTNRVPQRWNNEITDNQAIRYIHKMYWYKYFHLAQEKNISIDKLNQIADYYHQNNLQYYFNEKKKPKASSQHYYLMHRENILENRKQKYQYKKQTKHLSTYENLSERMRNEMITGYVEFI